MTAPEKSYENMRDAPILRKRDEIRRRFMLTIFFDNPETSEEFTAEDLSTTLCNAFNHWRVPARWSDLNISEIEREDKFAEFDTLALINELQARKVRMKVDNMMMRVVVMAPAEVPR